MVFRPIFICFFVFRSKHKNQKEYIDKSGIHVVVGHYMGDLIPGKNSPNLSQGT